MQLDFDCLSADFRLRKGSALTLYIPRFCKNKNLRKVSKTPDFSRNQALLVGEGGFEPPKSLTTDLQSAPFGHSGIPPYTIGAGRRTRTPDLLITNPPRKVKCLILQDFHAFSLHISLLNQQVLSAVSIGKFRVVGQRVGQMFFRVHVSRTRQKSCLPSPDASKIRSESAATFVSKYTTVYLLTKAEHRYSRLP